MLRGSKGTIIVVLVFLIVIGSCAFALISKGCAEKQAENDFAQLRQRVATTATETDSETQKVTLTEETKPKNKNKTAVTEGTKQESYSVNELFAMNDECYAWLSINDTRISYPVMHTPNDPDKYLNKNFYGQYSSSGVPYMDARCTENSDNKIVYGHNMRYGTMFADLRNYTSRMFRDSHQDVILETHSGQEVYKVFATLRVKSDDYWYNFIDAETAKKYDTKISYAIEHSIYKTRIVPKYGQKLLTLSTCYGNNSDDRLIVIAVKQ